LKKVFAFDCYDTVFAASGVPSADEREYISQVRRPEWAPLELPQSFYEMPPHRDAKEGIARLRTEFLVVTCSNLPRGLLLGRSAAAGILWDAIVPLEASRSYKPAIEAYFTVCEVMQVLPHDVTVVTAHADGPDIEGAPAAGMSVQLIRNPGCPQTIIELAESLGC
jgi:FMN phosphatase YigB (HAD superfamily)